MKLVVAQLKDGENAFEFASGQDVWLKDILRHVGAQGYRVEGELKAQLRLIKVAPDYYLKGQMEFSVEQCCARCAELFCQPMKHRFDVSLVHSSQTKAPKPTVSDESNELDVNFFEGNEIDLSPILQEQFFLSLPYQPLCVAECKGVCQKCGKNLNSEACGCPEESPEGPFAVLKNFSV